MNRREGERLIEVIRELMAETGSASVKGKGSEPAPEQVETDKDGRPRLSAELLERVYQQFRNRMIDDLRADPVFVELLAARPEIEVLIEPRRIQIEASTTRGRVARLMASGWFKTTRATGAVRTELARTGPDPGGGGTLSDILAAYVKDGFLVREGTGYQAAPDLKVKEKVLEVS